jgi:signal transduction histidine kinase
VRDEFLAIASHELRTPLTSLRLQVDALNSTFSHGPAAVDLCGRRVAAVGRDVRRLSALIDNLLDVSRISVGQLILDRRYCDLGEASREVTERFVECAAQQAGSTLRFQGTGPLFAAVDRLRFEQVLTNLISNAIKYGSGQPIDVAVAQEAAPVQNYGGLGLGLYVAQQIMVAHGGTLEVTSAPGSGAVFTACFPALATDAPTRTDLAAPDRATDSSSWPRTTSGPDQR